VQRSVVCVGAMRTGVSCELIAQAEYILIVALRQNDCRLDSAFSVILKAMEICEGFPFLGGVQKRALLRDILERIAARAGAAETLLPETTRVSLAQTLEGGGLEGVAGAIVEVSKGRARVNPVYAAAMGGAAESVPPPGCLAGMLAHFPKAFAFVRGMLERPGVRAKISPGFVKAVGR